MFCSFECSERFLEEEKRFRMGTRGTNELIYIDQDIIKEIKLERENIAMTWIDNKKSRLNGPANLDNRISKNI